MRTEHRAIEKSPEPFTINRARIAVHFARTLISSAGKRNSIHVHVGGAQLLLHVLSSIGSGRRVDDSVVSDCIQTLL